MERIKLFADNNGNQEKPQENQAPKREKKIKTLKDWEREQEQKAKARAERKKINNAKKDRAKKAVKDAKDKTVAVLNEAADKFEEGVKKVWNAPRKLKEKDLKAEIKKIPEKTKKIAEKAIKTRKGRAILGTAVIGTGVVATGVYKGHKKAKAKRDLKVKVRGYDNKKKK